MQVRRMGHTRKPRLVPPHFTPQPGESTVARLLPLHGFRGRVLAYGFGSCVAQWITQGQGGPVGLVQQGASKGSDRQGTGTTGESDKRSDRQGTWTPRCPVGHLFGPLPGHQNPESPVGGLLRSPKGNLPGVVVAKCTPGHLGFGFGLWLVAQRRV